MSGVCEKLAPIGAPLIPESMHLPGRLDQTTLGDLLGRLHRQRATGILELVEERGATAGRTHQIRLCDGWPIDVVTPLRVERLGEILIRLCGVRRPDVVRRTLGGSAQLGQRLLRAGLIDETSLALALRCQLVLRFDALFALSEARITFHVMQSSCPTTGNLGLPRSRQFLRGRPRFRDTHRTVQDQPSTRSRPVPGDTREQDLSALGLGPRAEPAEVRRAFRRLAAMFHPDRCTTAPPEERARMERRFVDLTAAYHRLAG